MASSRVRSGLLRALAILLAQVGVARALPPVPVPAENPVSEEKRVLGKILFWDQQLSSDDTVACGSCHDPGSGGADPRIATHPGADGVFGSDDDVSGSPGVVRRAPDGSPSEDPVFGFGPQVTARAAPNFFGGLWSPQLFADGRAGPTFSDPLDGSVVIASGGALESQSLVPIVSPVEMAKEGRTWAEVTAKLQSAVPLALASDLPADVAAALAGSPGYPDLFEAAFGDPGITPVRIAFAIASYERTLVADQTPWDAYMARVPGSLTEDQELGWLEFQSSACANCHLPPVFTDDSFRNIGVRDPAEDPGREGVTGDPADRGRFRVTTLRNSGLKPTFMHNGRLLSMAEVLAFYQPGQQFTENLDLLMPVQLSASSQARIADFIGNALVDPRVAARSFPFDRPTLGAPGPEPTPVPSVSPPGAAALVALLLGIGALALLRRPRPVAAPAPISRR